jgi:hypothetical protein
MSVFRARSFTLRRLPRAKNRRRCGPEVTAATRNSVIGALRTAGITTIAAVTPAIAAATGPLGIT